MQESNLVPMKIPEHAKSLESATKTLNHTSDYDMHTSTVLKWVSGLELATATSTLFSFLPTDGFHIAGFVGFIITGISAFVFGVVIAMESATRKGIRKGIKTVKETPNYGEWISSSLADTKSFSGTNRIPSLGYCVRKTNVNSVLPHLLNPMRFFGGVTLSETLWYNPVSDIYALETEKLSTWKWEKSTEKFAGRRKTLTDALRSL